jgi:poly(beta-D-mannuronate) lyase
MLRRGDKSIKTKLDDGTPNKNNWVFSSAPPRTQLLAGGVDGVLEATLAVNHVTTTGGSNEVGRVIIGQIHAKDDEPIRLYYRKLPDNTHGSIYAAHERKGDPDDIYYEIIGSRSSTAPNPSSGFQLNEKFSYKIEARGNFLQVAISQDGETLAETTIDMTNSGYDVANDYMYFKAGVYNQNKTGEPDDYVQATFYRLKTNHD